MRTRHVVIVCFALFAFGLIFWPGLYRYDQLRSGTATYPVRTNRLTGYTEMFIGTEWISAGSRSGRKESLSALPPAELAKLSGRGQFRYGTSFEVDIYNGSLWAVREVRYRITSRTPGDRASDPLDLFNDVFNEWEREFHRDISIEPLASAKDFFTVGGVQEGNVAEWKIVAARGVPPKDTL